MKKLIAKRPILYGSRMYEAGDTLPANDERMVNAWLAAESAELIDTEKAIECADQEIADIPADETAADAHIDPAQLEGMSKDELKKLAEDMGVELPRGAAKALIIDRLTALPFRSRPKMKKVPNNGHFLQGPNQGRYILGVFKRAGICRRPRA